MSLFKAASTVSLLTLASRITGLLRDLLTAALFGATALTDAFYVAFRIPNLFRRVFGEGAFSQAFVPVLAATRQKGGEAAAKTVVDHVSTVLAWTLLVLCLAGVVGAPLLVWALASGLKKTPHAYDAAVVMTRVMFPYIGFMSLVALVGGVLNTWKKFAVPAFAPVLLNVSLIVAMLGLVPVFRRWGIEPIYSQCVGVMVGGLLQLAIQWPALRGIGMWPRIGASRDAFREAMKDEGTRQVLRLMLPALLGVSVAQISLLINTQIASYLAPGSVSWLNAADRLMEFPTALLGVALGVVLMPQLAAARAGLDTERYSTMLDWGLRLVVLLAVPSSAALLVFPEPLVATLFHYGAFRDNDVVQVALALGGYGTGLLGLVAIKVLAPGYYASHDMKTPMRIAIVALVATQLLNVVLVPRLQHAGLALSIGLGALLNAGWLLVGLWRRGSWRPAAGWTLFLLQVVAATALLASFLAWASTQFDWLALRAHAPMRAGLLAAVLAVAALIYFGALRIGGLRLRQFVTRW
ncbi:murein biosynthesis integral membrane protein MurJ [Ramlibacter sp. MMS24-I3-19]|uniref:murein biosynthesis integral membrane protein MurJ n=1 Tax=Ramlibacter sp. MMS24-I3-19 TaxID=3416606 RepID=UPI003CFE84F0